jgi:PAS domain S-box-containing protein
VTQARQAAGIALLCDLEGNIVDVIRDGFGIGDRVSVGQPLSLVVDTASLGKALSFLVELKEHGAAFDWQIRIPIDGDVTTLHFAGIAKDNRLLVIGAKSSEAIRQIGEELTPVETGQIDALLLALKEYTRSAQSPIEQDNSSFDELSRLNNELVTLQREIAKKNVELEKLNDQVQQHASELERRVEERTAELQASEARFRALFEQAAIGIILIDLEGRVLDSNPALQEMLGCGTDELCGTLLWQFVSPDDPKGLQQIFGELTTDQPRYQKLEERFVRSDARQGWADITLSLVRGQEGEPRFVIGMVADVTEKKKTQAALLQAEKLAIAGRLAASLAHEINNPLQTVTGCIGLAQEALAEGEDPGELLHVAMDELRRVARVVAELRDLHRPPSLEEKESTDVNGLIEQVLTLSRKKCEEHGVEVSWQPEDGLPLIELVPDRIQQVFLNLVLNALDAMSGGGQLDVRTEHSRQPLGVAITIADSGEGISSDVLPHIFEPFFTSKPEGLGLGLFISQDIVQRHGGRIEVESQVGRGTTFTVCLPE